MATVEVVASLAQDTNATTTAITCGASVVPAIGDVVIALVQGDGSTGASGSVADSASAGNVYASLGSIQGPSGDRADWFDCQIGTAWTASTTTLTWTHAAIGTRTNLLVLVIRAAGITAAALDKSGFASAVATTTTPNACAGGATGTLSQADEVCIAAYYYGNTSAFTPPSTEGGWSTVAVLSQDGSPSTNTIAAAKVEVSATTSLSSVVATIGTTSGYGGILQTYKKAAAAAADAPFPYVGSGYYPVEG